MKEGDDVTLAGKVVKLESGYVAVKTKSGEVIWIAVEDVKTWRPGRKYENE